MTLVRTIIEKIDSLKPVRQVANKVMAIAKDIRSSMSELSEVIEVYGQKHKSFGG
jgi:hypothetical protein